MQRPFQRHDLVWLDPDFGDWLGELAFEQETTVRQWLAQGRPCVVARQCPEVELEGKLSLGFTLPAPQTRRRIFLAPPRRAVLRHSAPLELQGAVIENRVWRGVVEQVTSICSEKGAVPYLYGSLSWQLLTGESYLTATSDLDTLLVCHDETRLGALLQGLSSLGESFPKVDGEILSPTGWATSWRELAGAWSSPGALVLAKSIRDVKLMTVEQFLGPVLAKREAAWR